LYDVDPSKTTTFCYTQIQTITFGRYCLPTEPINRQYVDAEMSTLTNLIKRIAGDLGQVILNRKS